MKLTVKTHWRDNNNNRAQMWFRPGVTDSYAGAMAIAMPIINACIAVSDALLLKVEFEWDLEIAPGVPAVSSDLTEAAVFFYRNGTNVASILIPSVTRVLAELAGEYAGKRITRESATAVNLLTTLELIPTGLIDPLGRAYGTEFVVAGFTLP